jgi:hypothetical protein
MRSLRGCGGGIGVEELEREDSGWKKVRCRYRWI